MADEYFFEDESFSDYLRKIKNDSFKLIEKIIKKHSVIQVGENVEVIMYNSDNIKMRVTTVKLMAINSWGGAGTELSFYYEGIPLSKNGKPMKNRNPQWFGTFIKDGKKYHCPSYLRVEIIPAIMYKK